MHFTLIFQRKSTTLSCLFPPGIAMGEKSTKEEPSRPNKIPCFAFNFRRKSKKKKKKKGTHWSNNSDEPPFSFLHFSNHGVHKLSPSSRVRPGHHACQPLLPIFRDNAQAQGSAAIFPHAFCVSLWVGANTQGSHATLAEAGLAYIHWFGLSTVLEHRISAICLACSSPKPHFTCVLPFLSPLIYSRHTTSACNNSSRAAAQQP